MARSQMTPPAEIICISCPIGCNMTVQQENDEIIIAGNQCNAGISYAKEEITSPTRNIATSIRVTDGDMLMLSVKTARPIPKSAIRDVVDAIHQVTIAAPVKIGDIVLANAAGTGVDILATRCVGRGDMEQDFFTE